MDFKILIAAGYLISSVPLIAQSAPPAPTSAQARAVPMQPKWALTVGVAPVVAPPFQGSRETALSVFPDIRVNFRDDVFLSVPDGLGWNVVNRDGWKLGPLAKLRFGRLERTGGSPFLVAGGSDALIGFGNIGAAAELGGFAQRSFDDGRLRLRGEVRQGFGGHDGVVADMLVAWSDNVGGITSSWRYGLGVRASFGNRDFTNVYFGVSPAQAEASGLPASQTGASLVTAGVSGNLMHLLGPRGRDGIITLFVNHDRLGDVVARSSLIEERGQRGQTGVGLSYAYRFTWN